METQPRRYSLPLLLHICFCAATYSSNENYFITPDYAQNVARTFVLGSTLNVSWHTNLTTYAIELWQEYPKFNGAQPSATTVYNQTGSDPEITSFNWTVTPYELDLDLSHTFYFWLNGTIPSAYFKIYNSSTTTTSPSLSQPTPSQQSSPGTTTSSAQVTVTTSPEASSSNSTSLAIGLGVGLGVGLPLAILCGVCLGFRMRRRQDDIDTYGRRQEPPSPQQSHPQRPAYAYEKVTPAPSELASPPVELYTSPSELEISSQFQEQRDRGP